ncbi:MAG: tRNA (adenosine(37)-N6)-threonylcarbamoyltransferase complex dimerization subunit type 1 TsaB [Gammaproteobacteria bacterium]|nr:tRNA (adenosine(37)-N6)-threonylcarbamoyltransferase complex dimerization subunit type 1 TsaB [Gammaproteobacteria bacterium]MCD8524964.1 tRNA (adenosine(37)-N6)-threonylcarbamoyltransferase complex dimerization subunit type 1 TsaB [Gammaproteobacteria bacterium]MCD8541987.1 tRNA (adenosine(37)-N6)-threonylcarbamoyltransferase complex dimerization subunit type 1 TsaB [Gammaproteobacteria bacterium]
MKILAVDASGNSCSVALFVSGAYEENRILSPRHQGEFILDMVQDILLRLHIQGESLDGIVFGCGPGSFTGIRLTAGVAQGLAVGWNKPLLPVSNLAALAYKKYQASPDARSIWVGIDARKEEVYTGVYAFHPQGMDIVRPDQLMAVSPLSMTLDEPPFAIDILHVALYLIKHSPHWVTPDKIELAYLRHKVTD